MDNTLGSLRAYCRDRGSGSDGSRVWVDRISFWLRSVESRIPVFFWELEWDASFEVSGVSGGSWSSVPASRLVRVPRFQGGMAQGLLQQMAGFDIHRQGSVSERSAELSQSLHGLSSACATVRLLGWEVLP